MPAESIGSACWADSASLAKSVGYAVVCVAGQPEVPHDGQSSLGFGDAMFDAQSNACNALGSAAIPTAINGRPGHALAQRAWHANFARHGTGCFASIATYQHRPPIIVGLGRRVNLPPAIVNERETNLCPMWLHSVKLLAWAKSERAGVSVRDSETAAE